jgi:DNA-binding GntR family transcriptional regulator
MSKKTVLRDKIKEQLLFQIHQGDLAIGKTINLAELSRETGISVTPIREALSQLEQVGAICAVPNRGFMVPKLSKKEVHELIATLSQLEVMALEQSNLEAMDLDELAHLQQQMTLTGEIRERLQLRFKFHDCLTQNCKNSVLVQLINDLRLRLRFYEYQLVNELAFFEKMDQQTHAIVHALLDDNLPTASLILKMHWLYVEEYLNGQL